MENFEKKEHYRKKIAEMVKKIENEKFLKKIYSFIRVFVMEGEQAGKE